MSSDSVTKSQLAFEKLYGYKSDGVWAAPGRVNLIGEHTDYNDGFVFPFAIDRETIAVVAARNDNIVRVASSFSAVTHEADISRITKDRKNDWAAYPFGEAWAIQKLSGKSFKGFDCYIDSNVPVGAGLSSSAAIECSVGVALNELWNAGLTRPELARAGQLAENEIVGAPTGIMDQSASLLGERDKGVFLDCRSLEAKIVPLDFEKHGLELVIIDTKVAHRHSDGGYAARRQACEDGAKAMGVTSLRDLTTDDLERAKDLLDDVTYRRVKHVITENERVLETIRILTSSGPQDIGKLMYESHVSMRDDFEISVVELDAAVETALAFGAVGARMTGGGFGGAAIALTPKDKIDSLTLAVKYEFKKRGFIEPNIFTVRASQGAHRVTPSL
jgi:galactokinase